MSNTNQEGLSIGLDVGTQSTKGVVLDSRKRGGSAIIARATRSYDLLPGLPEGAAEQHPHTWRDAVRDVISELLRALAKDGHKLEDLVGIGVSGQQHGLVVLGDNDEVLRPAKLWCDTTTTAEADAITKAGRFVVPTGFTLPKLLWIKNNEPQLFSKIAAVLLPHDYVNFLLTGKKFMECGDASGSGAFDPVTRSFDEEILDFVDPQAKSLLPGLVAPDRIAGRVSPAGADFFGLPEGLPVAPGGGDNMMSAIGSGATNAGVTVMSLGTSGTVFAYSDRAIVDDAGLIAGFCDSTGAWMPLLCTMNVTGVTEGVRESFQLSHEQITKLAEAVPAGSEGLTFLPYLQGERVPNLPLATGALLGIRPGLMSPGHLFRAAIEGTTLGLVSGVERMKQLGLDVRSIRLVGGGSKNPLWRQVIADSLGVPVQVLMEPESAALGGAIQAMWVVAAESGRGVTLAELSSRYVELADGVTQPNEANYEVYQARLRELQEKTAVLFS